MTKAIKDGRYINAQWQLEALLLAVKRGAECISDEVMDRIQFTYELTHSRAQDMPPEKSIKAKKTYHEEENVWSATFTLDSEISTDVEATAIKFKKSEIRINPNDLTVFRVDFHTD